METLTRSVIAIQRWIGTYTSRYITCCAFVLHEKHQSEYCPRLWAIREWKWFLFYIFFYIVFNMQRSCMFVLRTVLPHIRACKHADIINLNCATLIGQRIVTKDIRYQVKPQATTKEPHWYRMFFVLVICLRINWAVKDLLPEYICNDSCRLPMRTMSTAFIAIPWSRFSTLRTARSKKQKRSSCGRVGFEYKFATGIVAQSVLSCNTCTFFAYKLASATWGMNSTMGTRALPSALTTASRRRTTEQMTANRLRHNGRARAYRNLEIYARAKKLQNQVSQIFIQVMQKFILYFCGYTSNYLDIWVNFNYINQINI